VSKYNNKRVQADGYTFDSKVEYQRYQELRLLERAGTICDLQVHPVYELLPTFTDRTGKRHAPVRYEADFSYCECVSGRGVVEDVKGVRTEVFRIKMKMFLRWYGHLDFRLIVR
jgi:hypothetical protein